MDNGTFQPGNDLYNRVSTIFGAPAPTNYNGLKEALAGEMDRALHGTSTIEGRQAISATMPAKAAPGQMAGIVETALHTLGAKMQEVHEQYQQGTGGKDPNWTPILPSALAVFQKHGFDPTAGPQSNVKGSVGSPIPAPVSTLLSAPSVKPGIHKLSDGSSWMKGADGTITRQ